MNPNTFIEPKLDLVRLSKVLDEIGAPGRLATVRSWTPALQKLLFEAAKGWKALTLEHFVPAAVAANVEVRHPGKNTLPMFSVMEKRFSKPDDFDARRCLVGYNHQAMIAFTGPGYFTATDVVETGEVRIDYGTLPSVEAKKPPMWPDVIPNEAKLGRFVYAGLTDELRAISSHVSIGRALRNGEPLGQWFAMVRVDP